MTSALRLPFLLLLLLLTPGVGFAQAESPPPTDEESSATESPGTEEGAKQGAKLQPPKRSDWPPPPGPPASRGGRVVSEVGLALFMSLGGGFLGLMGGMGYCKLFPSSTGGWFPCLAEGLYGVALGAMVTIPLGVYWAGNFAGGNGLLLHTLAGEAAGALVGLALVGGGGPLMAVPALLFPLIGSIIGYESSVAAQAPPKALGSVRLQPVLAVSPSGTVVGLGGRF